MVQHIYVENISMSNLEILAAVVS